VGRPAELRGRPTVVSRARARPSELTTITRERAAHPTPRAPRFAAGSRSACACRRSRGRRRLWRRPRRRDPDPAIGVTRMGM